MTTEKLKKEKTMHKFEDFKIGTRVKHDFFGEGFVCKEVWMESILICFDKQHEKLHSGGGTYQNQCYFYKTGTLSNISQLTIISEFTPKFKKGDSLVYVNNILCAITLELDKIYIADKDSYIGAYNNEFVDLDGYILPISCDRLKKLDYHPITAHNIKEVLEYNGLNNCYIDRDGVSVYLLEKKMFYVNFANPNWIKHIELGCGKLKPLPIIPEFDFHAYMLENEFTSHDKYKYTYEKSSTVINVGVPKTKENADLLIKIAELDFQFARK
jgi:hypothetical protein